MEKPLLDTKRVLQKFAGKGGWTYVEIPEIPQDKTNPFGWVIVRGFIDNFELNQCKLMPMGNGQLFLPVKAAIRQRINKTVGDFVHIVIYKDTSKVEIPEDIMACFQDEPEQVYQVFLNFSDSERKVYLDWILSAKSADKQAERILQMMDRLKNGLRFYDQSKD